MDNRNIRYMPENRRSSRTGRYVRGAYDDMEERYDSRYDDRYEDQEDAYDEYDEYEGRAERGAYGRYARNEYGRGQRMNAIGFRGNVDMEYGGAESEMPKHLTKGTAKKWVREMDPPGKWTMEQTTQVMHRNEAECNEVDFFAAMNMMYSDYREVAQEIGQDNPDFYAKLAKAFLCDEDAAEGKLVKYYGVIVEH